MNVNLEVVNLRLLDNQSSGELMIGSLHEILTNMLLLSSAHLFVPSALSHTSFALRIPLFSYVILTAFEVVCETRAKLPLLNKKSEN